MSEVPQAMITDPVVERLDRLATLLELALAPQLEDARARIRADALDAAILDAAAGGWTPAAKLKQAVRVATGKKKRAIEIHLAELVGRGFVHKQGASATSEYKTNGVV